MPSTPASLRKYFSTRRRQLSPIRACLAATRINKTLDHLSISGPVASYLSIGAEVNTRQINMRLHRRGLSLYMPVTYHHGHMIFVKWAPFAQLDTGAYGIRHPRVTPQRTIQAKALKTLVTPLVAFDRNGNRLGMGGGYYDRYLATASNATTIGIAFNEQHADRLPTQAWDQALNTVLTPSRRFQRKQRRT